MNLIYCACVAVVQSFCTGIKDNCDLLHMHLRSPRSRTHAQKDSWLSAHAQKISNRSMYAQARILKIKYANQSSVIKCDVTKLQKFFFQASFRRHGAPLCFRHYTSRPLHIPSRGSDSSCRTCRYFLKGRTSILTWKTQGETPVIKNSFS